MITETKIIMYRATCDGCLSILEKKYHDMIVFDMDEDGLYERIEEERWQEIGNKIFCSKCIDAKA